MTSNPVPLARQLGDLIEERDDAECHDGPR
jgi:hypothetical protein